VEPVEPGKPISKCYLKDGTNTHLWHTTHLQATPNKKTGSCVCYCVHYIFKLCKFVSGKFIEYFQRAFLHWSYNVGIFDICTSHITLLHYSEFKFLWSEKQIKLVWKSFHNSNDGACFFITSLFIPKIFKFLYNAD